MRNTKNIIIGAFLIAILVMTIGYASFSTELTLNGTTEIISEWDVKISNIEIQSASPGTDAGTPSFTNTSVSFNAKLGKPGDKIVYLITIENDGTIDAKLNNIIFKDDENGSSAIKYATSELNNNLDAGEATTFSVTVTYDPNYTEIPTIKTKSITGIIEYSQK